MMGDEEAEETIEAIDGEAKATWSPEPLSEKPTKE
jgi:hypothetical protein